MSWFEVFKKEFKIFDDEPMNFYISVMTSKNNQRKIKNKVLKFYGDDYMDMVDMKRYSTFNDFFKSKEWNELKELSNLTVVVTE